jgi:hypothetical protein
MSSTNPLYPPLEGGGMDQFQGEFKDGPDQIMSTMRDINDIRDKKLVLVPDSVKNDLIHKHTGVRVNNPMEIGPVLMSSKAIVQGNQRRGKSLFHQHYIDPETAKAQHDSTMFNTDEILKKHIAQGNIRIEDTVDKVCRVFPPLRVRYNNMGDFSDKVIAVVVLKSGELKPTQEFVPDIVLTFHGRDGTITFTTCFINKNKMRDMMIAVTTLSAMKSRVPLNLSEFSKLYTGVWHQVLHHQVLHK